MNFKLKEIEYDPQRLFAQIITKFTINCASHFVQEFNKNFVIKDINCILNEIDSYSKTMGIMICDFQISENFLSAYLFVFDNQIIICNETDLQQFQPFFDKLGKTQLFFFNKRCENEIRNLKNKKKSNSENDNIKIDQTDLCEKIKCHIVQCIIRKSQIMTQNRRFKSTKKKETQKILFYFNDFISINNLGESTYLCFNTKDQFLYVLKYFDNMNDDSIKRYDHEIEFYQNYNNKNPFISKFYGTANNSDYNVIIIEYIEGQTLLKFIENERGNLEKLKKIQIILEIMCVLEYLHLNNFIYRDLKPDNIIIDNNCDAILIDFDQAKQINEKSMTLNIGCDDFASPEQLSTKNYSIESDIYSLGKIIQFVITENMTVTNRVFQICN